jgi:hypothetical protein
MDYTFHKRKRFNMQIELAISCMMKERIHMQLSKQIVHVKKDLNAS